LGSGRTSPRCSAVVYIYHAVRNPKAPGGAETHAFLSKAGAAGAAAKK
jgi:hypothetical protein